MGGLRDRYDTHVWGILFALLGIAVVPFLVPPSVGMSAGLTLEQYILVAGAVELIAALGIAAVVISHYNPEPEPESESSEWKYGR